VEYLAVTALSHEGLVRDHNEDSLLVGPWTTPATVTQTPHTVYFPLTEPVVVGVAVGLGGHPAGEVASTLAVQELARAGPTLTHESSVRAALQACNDTVYAAAAHRPDWGGMGTTVAGVVVTGDDVIVFNVGDSRVYTFADGALSQVSVDDNPPLSPGQTHTSVLTQTIGGHPRDRAFEPHLSTHARVEHGVFLICSDGLSDVVEPEAIGAILQRNSGPQATYKLWRAAIDGGGPDNITVVVAELRTSDDRDGS
jgi:serine/threonine protein phosphatase PrpC